MMLSAKPLTAEGFAPFGQVLSVPGDAPSRVERAATLDNRRATATPNLAVIRYPFKDLPLEIPFLERHRFSTQSFMPMVVSRYLVVVCPSLPDGNPDTARVQAFVAGPGQGVNYAADVWHAGMSPLDSLAEFAMFIHQDGTDDDCQFLDLDEPLIVTIPD